MKIKKFLKKVAVSIFLAAFSHLIFAEEFTLPNQGNLIGKLNYDSANSTDTLLAIGQKHNVGMNSMINANPGFNETTTLPQDMPLTIPTQFMLPPIRKGIVINLPEMRMYYFLGDNKVLTFPIGIGKVGKTIPIAYTKIIRKTVNPTWTPPKSIRDFNLDQGIKLPKQIGPGPDNPLGPYAIYLKIPTYLIHSTIFPESIGRRASFGCIRMNENDIKTFFPLVKPGIPVAIIDMPIKIGWNENQLNLEVHPNLIENSQTHNNMSEIMNCISHETGSNGVTLINWQAVAYVAEQKDGMPHEIGIKIN